MSRTPLAVLALGLGAALSLAAQIEMKIPVVRLAGHPTDSGTFYAGTGTGLLKSTDTGRTWMQQPILPVGRIQPPIAWIANGRDPNLLYVGTDRAHGLLWRSTDGGASWQSAAAAFPDGAATDVLSGIEISTAWANIVYAQVRTGDGYQILNSTDGGGRWTRTGSAPVAVSFYAGDPSIQYYASGFRVFRSSDSGATWIPGANVRQPEDGDQSGVGAVDVSPLNPNRLLATMTGNYADVNGIFISTDAGATWSRVREGNNSGVRFDRQRPSQVVAGDCCGNFSVYHSSDQGTTWRTLKINASSITPISSTWLGLDPSSPDRVLAPSGSGVWLTADGGTNWTRVGTYRPMLVSEPDSVDISLAAYGSPEAVTTVTVRALEESKLPVTGYLLSPVETDWMSAAAGKLSDTAIDIRLKSSAVAAGSHEGTVHVAATGFFNPTLDIPVRLNAIGSAANAHFIAGSLASGYFGATATDPNGRLLVAGSYKIQRIEGDGTRTTLAGTGRYGAATEGAPAVESALKTIRALAYHPSGILHFIDWDDLVWKIDASGRLVRVAGSATGTPPANGSPALNSRFTLVSGLALDPSGTLYLAAYNQVWRIGADQRLELLAGEGTKTRIGNTAGLASNASGEVFYSDSTDHRISRIATSGVVTTVAGNGGAGSSGDGGAAAFAGLNQPGALAFDTAGNLYLADDNGHRVRRVRAADGRIETIGGIGLDGTGATCASAGLTPLSEVNSLTFLPDGTLAVNDYGSRNVYAVRLAGEGAGPLPAPGSGAVNAASYAPAVAPGSLFSLFGTGFSAGESQPAGAWPVTLGGATACFGNTPAPLSYAGPGQLNGQVPVNVPAGQARIRVFTSSGMSAPAEAKVIAAAPGVFMYGQYRAVAVNQDGQLNSATAPAAVNSWLTVYITGLGALDNPVATGQTAPFSPLSRAVAETRVTIGGKPGNVIFAGLTPGYVGLGQVNVQVPDCPAGDHQMIVDVGGVASEPVWVSVR